MRHDAARQSIFRKKPAPDLIRVETGFRSENAINAKSWRRRQ
jgi:hypothetical protein